MKSYLIWFVMVMKMFRQAWIVFFKELKCIIRDKKTFIVSLLLPLMLVPTMLTIIDFSMKNMMQNQISGSINIGISHKENSFHDFLVAQGNVNIVDVSNPRQALNSEKIAAYITVSDDIDQKVLKREQFQIDVQYSESSSLSSTMSKTLVDTYKDAYQYYAPYVENEEDLAILRTIKLQSEADAAANAGQFDMSSLLFNMLVPLMLIMYCFFGSVGTATELSAGEKEKGTLEPLLSTGANRTSIIIGKLLATTAMGVISGICTVLGLWGYLLISSSSNTLNLSSIEMIVLLLVTFFTAMFFAAINLTIGVYAKSYKEAQTYSLPLSLICIIPTSFTYTLDLSSIGLTHLCVPVLNIVCIIKEIFARALNIGHLSIVLGWLIVYVAIAFFVTSKLFKKESVVFRV